MYQVTKPLLQSRWSSSMNKWLLVRLIWVQLLCVSLFIYRHCTEFWLRVQASAKCTHMYFCSGFLIFPFQWVKVHWCYGILPFIQDVVFSRALRTSIHADFLCSPVNPWSDGGNRRSCSFLQNLHHSEKTVIRQKNRGLVLPTLQSSL